jgi:hypothetical protein
MAKENEILFLKVNSDRPDFRIIKVFIWGEKHNTDSDGDSYNPASRTWTQLYIGSREVKGQSIDICPLTSDPLIMKIQSPDKELAKQVTLFLSEETNGEIFADEALRTRLTNDEIKRNINVKDYNQRKLRTKNSIWRQSTLDNPYPNLQS